MPNIIAHTTDVAGFYAATLKSLSRKGKFDASVGEIEGLVADKFTKRAGDHHEIDVALRLVDTPYTDRDILKSFYGLSMIGIVPEGQIVKNFGFRDSGSLHRRINKVIDTLTDREEFIYSLSVIHPEFWPKGGYVCRKTSAG